MDLNKKTVRTILLIITFGIAISWLFNNLNYIPGFFKNITDFLTPFLLGCGLAYILNLPTRFFERTLFGKEWQRDNIRKRINGDFDHLGVAARNRSPGRHYADYHPATRQHHSDIGVQHARQHRPRPRLAQ